MTRRTFLAKARAVGALSALALVVAGCSIEGPRVELVGGGGPAPQGPAANVGPAPQGLAPGQTVAQGPADTSTATGAVTERVRTATGPVANQCLGKATDVGVTGTTIKLGSNFAASGPVSNISGPILKGVQAYFNEYGRNIHGRRIIFKWYDDGWDAQKGKGLVKKLVEQDKVFLISTIPSSNGLDASKSYLEQKRVPVIGTSGLIESQFKSSMQWPVGTGSKSAGRIGLAYAKERGAKSVAVIWLDLLAGREVMEAIQNAIKPIYGKEPADVLVNPDGYRVSISEPDFGPWWARVEQDTRRWQRDHGQPEDGRPDVVLFAIDPTNAVKALQAAKERGFRPKLFWAGGAPLFLDLVWQSTDYAAKTGLVAGTSFYPPIKQFENLPAVRDYVRTVRKYYGNNVDLNNPYLEGGYAGAALTIQLLKAAGPCLTRERVIQLANSLRQASAAGLTRPLTYTPTNHYGNIQALLVRVSPDNKWVVERDWMSDPTPGAA